MAEEQIKKQSTNQSAFADATADKPINKSSETITSLLDRTFPPVKPGAVVRVHQEITDINPKGEERKRIQVFEGLVIARQHGRGINATITVRKESEGIGVEKIFPLHLPTIKKIEVVKQYRVRRAKLNYVRGKHKRMKEVKSPKPACACLLASAKLRRSGVGRHGRQVKNLKLELIQNF